MGCFLGDPKGAPISSGRMTLLWSPESIHDLLALRAHINEHDPAAAKRVALHILYCVEYLLSENPKLGAPLLRKGLGRDVGSYVENFRQAEKRTFGVFDSINDVVAESRQARLASEVVVGVAKVSRFQSLGVFGFQFFDINIFQICFRSSGQTNARRLEKLHHLAGIAIN